MSLTSGVWPKEHNSLGSCSSHGAGQDQRHTVPLAVQPAPAHWTFPHISLDRESHTTKLKVSGVRTYAPSTEEPQQGRGTVIEKEYHLPRLYRKSVKTDFQWALDVNTQFLWKAFEGRKYKSKCKEGTNMTNCHGSPRTLHLIATTPRSTASRELCCV